MFHSGGFSALSLSLFFILFFSFQEVGSSSSSNEIVLVPFPLESHVSVFVEIGKELKSRKYSITVATSKEFKNQVQHAQLTFQNLGESNVSTSHRNSFPHALAGYRLAAEHMRLLQEFYGSVNQHRKTFEKTDLAVIDGSSIWALDLADVQHVPYVIVNPTPVLAVGPFEQQTGVPICWTLNSLSFIDRFYQHFWLPVQIYALSVTYNRYLNEIRQTANLPLLADQYMRWQNRLVISTAMFGLEYAQPTSPLMNVVGPILASEITLTSKEQEVVNWISNSLKPVVYVEASRAAFYAKGVIEAVQAAGMVAVISVGRDITQKLGNMPSSFKVVHDEDIRSDAIVRSVGEKIKLCISFPHYDSLVYELINQGIPNLLLPVFEHPTAPRVIDSHIGDQLTQMFSTSEAVSKIKSLTTNPTVKQSISNLKRIQDRLNGSKKAADIIETVFDAGTEHLIPFDRRLNFIQSSNVDIKLVLVALMLWIIYFIFKGITKPPKKKKKDE